MIRFSGRTTEQETRIAAAIDTARGEWESWKRELDAEFPGMRLDTPTDHARFEAFLERRPAPSWVQVEHADFTRIRLDADTSFLQERDRRGYPDEGYGYAAAGGVAFAATGAYQTYKGVTVPMSLPKTLLRTVGGPILAGFGVAAAIAGYQALNAPTPQSGAYALSREVDDAA